MNRVEELMNELKELGFREFTKEDWYGWAGAEEFTDGSQPLILETEEVTVVVSRDSICTYRDLPECDEFEPFYSLGATKEYILEKALWLHTNSIKE